MKFLVNEVIPRFSIPVTISSDNGPAFIGHVLRQFMQALRFKQRYGCVYHPQSQGMVERVNGILKAKINKICQDANLNWVDALPLALMCYRSQESRITHLSPYEMLTGRSAEGMPVALLFSPSFEIFSQQSYRYPVGLLQCERPSGQTGAGPPDWRDTPHYRSPRDPLLRMPSRSQYENLLLDRLGPLLDDASDQAHESYC